jgi:hypothetical protein
MKLSKLNEEIEKISMVKYHRAFVSPGIDRDTVDADTPVEITDIYIKDEVPLRQAIEELEQTCILEQCYAVIINAAEDKIYLTDRGKQRIVRYEGENYSSLEELDNKEDKPIHQTDIKEINLSFNVGSFNMIFG